MGKVVKLCSKCDEGFIEKFESCPNCGSRLQAFRLEEIAGTATAASDLPFSNERTSEAVAPIPGYSVTVIAEHNARTRNVLFAGALVTVVTVLLTGMFDKIHRPLDSLEKPAFWPDRNKSQSYRSQPAT